jgi:molybdate transport system ATP-binding protein
VDATADAALAADGGAVSGLDVRLRHQAGSFSLEVDFAVGDEVLVLFGPSGAGKTMTLRLVAGLDRPAAGEVRLDGRVLVSREGGVWVPPQGRRCGLVFHDSALFPHLDVRRNVLFGAPDAGADLARTLETFRIAGLSGRYPAELSGGETQRVALARALTARPRALLLDEPFSALDADTRRAMGDEVRAAQRAWRIPFVFVTHDRAEAERLGDRMIFIRDGRIVSELG